MRWTCVKEVLVKESVVWQNSDCRSDDILKSAAITTNRQSPWQLWSYMTARLLAESSANDSHWSSICWGCCDKKKLSYGSRSDETLSAKVTAPLDWLTHSNYSLAGERNRSTLARHAAQERNWKWVLPWREYECVGGVELLPLPQQQLRRRRAEHEPPYFTQCA